MRIGFMGAQGVGKSTLVDLFIQDHPQYVRATNIQRTLKTSFNLGINNEANYETQFAISAHYASEMLFHEDYISDRTIIDTFVYASRCELISELQLKYIEDVFSKSVYNYDIIFHIPIEFTPPEDGVRIVDDTYRFAISDCMEKYVTNYADANIVTLSGTINERYCKILQNIKGI